MACVGNVKAINDKSERVKASISLKVPGNEAKQYPLTFQKSKSDNTSYLLEASEKMPLTIFQTMEEKDDKLQMTVCITALEDVYFNYSQQVSTGFRHDDCQFYMPGFGIAVISALPKKRLRSIPQTVGWCVKTG